MSNPLLEEPRFTKWLFSIETIIQQTQPSVKLEATSLWNFVPISRSNKAPPSVTRPSRSDLTFESQDWIRIDYITPAGRTKGWCWVCSKDDPTDPLGTVKEGLIISPYKQELGVAPLPGLRRNGKKMTTFYTCGSVFDEFAGLGFFDIRSTSWVRIRDRKRQLEAYSFRKGALQEAVK